MKQLLKFFFFLGIFSCKPYALLNIEELSVEGFEPGKCYFTIQVDDQSDNETNTNLESFILEVEPTKFENYEVVYSSMDLMSKLIDDAYVTIQTAEPHIIVIIKDDDLSSFTRVQDPIGYAYCFVQVPGKWEQVFKSQLLVDSIIISKKRIIEESKIVKKFVKNVKHLKPNQLFFENGTWSKPNECIAVCDGSSDQVFLKLKQALIELGYSLKLDGLINADTKEAILDFQRKNNLTEGQIDFELLNKLGIEY